MSIVEGVPRSTLRMLSPLHRMLAVGVLLLGASPVCGGNGSSRTEPPPNVEFETQTVASGFDTIWELAWGPDNALWVTERPGIISRIDAQTGSVTRVGQIAVQEIGEGGLMGLAFHPDFSSQPFVYTAHTYAASSGTRNRVVRLRFDGTALGPPQTIFDNLPGGSIHNGSRLAVGPDRLLYVTAGDAGNSSVAQNLSIPGGKVLRLTLDGAPAPGNPFGSAVFTYGHRNPQGIVFAPDGTLYVTEHGPSDNDEVNRLEQGRNYGWPDVRGRCDGDAGMGELSFCQTHNVVEPMVQWTPTIAPAGLDYYNATLIPGWRGSLLFTALKGMALYRLALSPDGRTVTSQERLFEGDFGRLRDVLVAPDGSVYLATSNRDGRGSPSGTDDRIIRVRPR
jgi:glucose/arabinose dehydrogenase